MADNPILALVTEHASAGQTGTLMVVFDDNSIGRFYVAGGLLTTARYRNKEGGEALTLAEGRVVSNVRFHENADLVRSAEFIDGVDMPMPMPTTQTPAAASAQAVSAGPPLTHVMRTALEDLLSDYVGPVATVIIGDLPDVVDVDTAVDFLSREISDATAAAEFVQAAREIISA